MLSSCIYKKISNNQHTSLNLQGMLNITLKHKIDSIKLNTCPLSRIHFKNQRGMQNCDKKNAPSEKKGALNIIYTLII